MDLKEKTAIQVEYNGNVYNAFVTFNPGCLEFEFANNGDAYDGICFLAGKDFCRIIFKDIEYEFSDGAMSRGLFVCDLYTVLSASEGVVVTESFNEAADCSFVSRRQGSYSFSFEVFKAEDKVSYSLKIR